MEAIEGAANKRVALCSLTSVRLAIMTIWHVRYCWVDEALVPGSVAATLLSAGSATSEGEDPITPRQITSTFQAKRSEAA